MLGNGIYILAEIAKLTKMHPSTISSWFRRRPDNSGHGPLFDSDYLPVEGDYAYSFLDLIDVLIVGQFRNDHKVPMQVIRKAHNILQRDLNTKHPFCRGDLYTDKKRIFNLAVSEVGEKILSDVVSRQQFFTHIMEKLDLIVSIKDIEYFGEMFRDVFICEEDHATRLLLYQFSKLTAFMTSSSRTPYKSATRAALLLFA